MIKYIKFLLLGITFLILYSCNSPSKKPLIITFSADSSKIVVKDIDKAGLFYLKKHINTDSAYQQLVTVLQTPVDDDSTTIEMEWKGKLSLKGQELQFTPNLPFLKGKTYLVETILNAQFLTGEDIVKDKVETRIKPQQKVLKR